ncbi:MAG: PEGA domain-containing protein [Vicinamibacterales bacterium]
MPESDNAWDQQAGLISAAHAAASWARARRAQWTAVAPTLPDDTQAVHAADFAFDPDPEPVVVVSAVEPKPAPAPIPRGIDLQAACAGARRALELGIPLLPWLARGAAAAALLIAVVTGARYLWNLMPAAPAAPTRTAVDTRPVTAPAGKKAVASLRVTTTPPGAQVLVDGKARGVTPVTLADLSPGRHEVALKSDAGTVNRTVTVAANETAAIDEAIFSGFVTVYSPFDVTITEGGRVLRADDRHQIMLPAGPHELRLTNRALAYEAVRQVDVTPGEATNLQLAPEPSTLTVTASDAAEVWLDGARIGDTPLNGALVPLGAHEIIVKRAAGGERRFAVTIGAKPFSLNVEF